MDAIWKRLVPLAGILSLAGCAAQRYQADPIVASATASRFESRNLADSALQSFVEQNLGHPVSPWPPATWDLQTLSLAALYFNPALDSARARVAGTEAALITAGARPNPTLSIAPGIPSPYLLTLDFAIPIETAGKRGYRVQAARSLDQASRFDLADSAWTVRSGVRAALLNYIIASETLELFRSEEKVRQDQVNILERIFSAGEISRQSVDLARIELSKAHLAISASEGQIDEARAALAASIGIPVAGLRGAQFSWPGMDKPPDAESLSTEEVQREAVVNRLDIRRALAQYAAAEAGLQLEIAKQYPDINIGPGYTYEETHSFFTVGASTVVPLFNRNQGPIAEAETRRKEAAAAFLERQAQVIARSERALAVYTAALKELSEAESLRKLQENQMQITRQAIRSGTDIRLNLNSVEIQVWLLARARLDALARAQRALGELEDAVQKPVDPGGVFGIAPESPALKGLPKNLNR
ncbi:MAG: TolC family protein [Candidatus Acidoferrum typicum]|nr:TolC family protein [Candidatus Acidoferrum typicum]